MFTTCLIRAREQGPLIHLITNFVTANDCANAILAAGGTPAMAYDPREVAEFAAASAALVLNLGAVQHADAMLLAGERANALGRPVVLDPVAVGASQLRQRKARQLLEQLHFALIRGNASEIRTLAEGVGAGLGVDAAPGDLLTEASLAAAAEQAKALSMQTGAVVVCTGALDLVTDGARTFVGRNGCPELARITGSGCMLSALAGLFCAVSPDDPLEAALAAMALMGVCGERAAALGERSGGGTATFHRDLIDGMSLITPEELEREARYDQL